MSHLVTSLERPQDVNFKHNTNHITIVLFSILLTKFDGWNTSLLEVIYSYSLRETSHRCPQSVPKRPP